MPDEQQPTRPHVPLPAGYRQGIITAVTVLIGFSLLFFRYWDLNSPETGPSRLSSPQF